jgi:hypothetical protein
MPTPTVINKYQYKDSISRSLWDNKYFFDDFQTNPISAKVGGGAATGVAGDNDVLATSKGFYEYFIIGTQTTLAPVLDSYGLNMAMTGTDGQGIELCLGVTALSPARFIIGTDAAFFFKAQFKMQDVSGCNPLIIGFRKVAAFDATLANYTDFVSVGVVGTASPNTIYIQTQKATAGVVQTDTTQTIADGVAVNFTVKVSAAGVVTYLVNDAAPTVTAAYTFTTALSVIPFLRFTEASDESTYASCNYFEIGYQA